MWTWIPVTMDIDDTQEVVGYTLRYKNPPPVQDDEDDDDDEDDEDDLIVPPVQPVDIEVPAQPAQPEQLAQPTEIQPEQPEQPAEIKPAQPEQPTEIKPEQPAVITKHTESVLKDVIFTIDVNTFVKNILIFGYFFRIPRITFLVLPDPISNKLKPLCAKFIANSLPIPLDGPVINTHVPSFAKYLSPRSFSSISRY